MNLHYSITKGGYMLQFKHKEDMNEGDEVAGVCYAAAAEDLIKKAFAENEYEWDRFQPTVTGYLVNDERMNDEDAGLQRDMDRLTELTSQRRLTITDLKELGAIRRRLGVGVV